MIRIIGLLLLLYSPTLLESRTAPALEALQEALEQSVQDSTKSRLYSQMSTESGLQRMVEWQQSYADSAMKYAQRAGDPLLLVMATDAKARAQFNSNALESALEYYNQAYEISRQHPEVKQHSVYFKMQLDRLYHANILQQLHPQEVNKQLLELLEQCEFLNNPTLKSKLLERIALNYRSLNILDQALYYNNLAIATLSQSGDLEQLARARISEIDIYFNMCTHKVDSLQLRQLMAKCEAAYQFTIEANLPLYQPWPLLYWAKFHRYATEYDKARALLGRIDEGQAENRVLRAKYDLLAEIESDAGRPAEMYRSARKSHAYAMASAHSFPQLKANNLLLQYFLSQNQLDSMRFYAGLVEKGLDQVDTSKFLEVVYNSYELLSRFYKTSDLPLAMKLLEQAQAIRDRRIYYQQKALASVAKFQQELDALTSDKERLSQDTHFLSLQNSILGGLALLLSLGGFWFYKRSQRLRQQKHLLEKEQFKAQQAVEVLSQQVQKPHLILNNKSKIYLEDLRLIKSNGNYLEFHLDGEKQIDRNRLKQVSTQLPPNFVQIHRSYIVNRNFIKVQQASSVLIDPDIEVPVSRTFKHQL